MTQTQTATQKIAAEMALASPAKALRVIGQDLASLFPRLLEIETDGVSYQVHGESHPNPFESVKEGFFRKAWHRLLGKDSAKPEAPQIPPAVFQRSYSAEDIERIDRENSANRTGLSQRADSYSLGERLRTMGAIVEKRNGRFKRLAKNADRLEVEYWDRQGQTQSARLTTVIMYRSERRQDAPAWQPPMQLWEGYDF